MSSNHRSASSRHVPYEQIFNLICGNYDEDKRSLYRIYKRRRKAGPRDISRCSDLMRIKDCANKTEKDVRTDSGEYQYEAIDNEYLENTNMKENIGSFFQNICPQLKKRFIIYGHYGSGTYAVIFGARERYPRPNCRPKHYVIKTEFHRPISQGWSPNRMGVHLELESAHIRYIPMEAIIMQLVSQCKRFPRLDSVYLHKDFQAIVMEANTACYTHEQIDYLPEISALPVPALQACSQPGNRLIRNKKPLLNEIQACKVASQLLQGIMYLMDLNISHDDLSHRNYLVDKHLNTQLIDFGLSVVAIDESRFIMSKLCIIHAFEYQLAPEMVYELAKPYYVNKERSPGNSGGDLNIHLPHDVRVVHLWKFGVLVYDLLHGYSPWELPGPAEEVGDVKAVNMHDCDRFRQLLDERRARVLNEELSIDENLSQDCVDVLRAMLAKEVENRPSLSELVSFPWFQGHWADYPLSEFERPDLG
ncbi:serine/threonine protein kinase [[Emmonsia] crescens]|uniref:EKC/KEOPS complex subunit BUD32 n=1 Tax=[Emmonsia] crescens TaxID=73230 RepID=A0A2B7ZBJ9_9EURO|nr:serine/threonine protein kinase [Emmonsia crescens]